MADPENAPAPDELAAIKAEFAEFRDAFKAYREANTPAEKEEAREDVAESEEALSALAKRMGITPSALRKATADAKRAEQKEQLRPIISELLEELVGDDDEDDDDAKPDPLAGFKEPPKVREPKLPPEDNAPERPHWSSKAVGDLLR